MKVLEKGPGWGLKLRCTGKGNGDGGCGSLLQVEESDIYITTHTDMTGETDYYYTICCPVCGKETDIPEKDLPSIIMRKALDEYREIYNLPFSERYEKLEEYRKVHKKILERER